MSASPLQSEGGEIDRGAMMRAFAWLEKRREAETLENERRAREGLPPVQPHVPVDERAWTTIDEIGYATFSSLPAAFATRRNAEYIFGVVLLGELLRRI